MSMSVEWTGLNEMIASFEEVKNVVQQEIIPYAMSFAIQTVSDVSQSDVPVRTGFLKNSMILRSTNPAEATVAYTAPYALFVERGTSRMAGRLYLQAAFEQGSRALLDQLTERIGSAFEFTGRKY